MFGRCQWTVLAFQVLLATAVAAQERAPSSLAPDELVTKTRAALEELTSLEAEALADREAFERSDKDLRRTIAELQNALPARPLPPRSSR